MDPHRREIFVNIPATRPPVEQSFEETRIDDYIHAYTTTGRPPQPSPPQPADKNERARAGLPPLWVPYVEVGGSPASQAECAAAAIVLANLESSAVPPPKDLKELPEIQIFYPTPDANEAGNKVYLQSIVCQHLFSGFSPEELRFRAYTAGKIYALKEEEPVLDTTDDTGSHLQSISTIPQFSKHSFEELRLAYQHTHRELTSEQINQMHVLG